MPEQTENTPGEITETIFFFSVQWNISTQVSVLIRDPVSDLMAFITANRTGMTASFYNLTNTKGLVIEKNVSRC